MNSMRNLYEQVYQNQNHKPAPSINQAYANVYMEKNELDDPEEDNVIVYYSMETEGQEILDSLMNEHLKAGVIKAASMDRVYFEKKVVGRLDQAMHKVAEVLVKRIFGKEDKVAFKALYDVMAENVMASGTCENLIKFKTGEIRTDTFMDAMKRVSGYAVVDVVPLLVKNFESCYQTENELSNPTRIINQLWDVKDVSGRTSVGRGELAMCMFSTAIKGSPGDVVEAPVTPYTDAGVASFDGAIKIEVKGNGGRPGLGNFAHEFAKNVPAILKNHTANVGEIGTINSTSMTPMQQNQLNVALQTSPKGGATPEDQIQQVMDELTKYPGADVNTLSSYLNVDATIDDQWRAGVKQWFDDFMATHLVPIAKDPKKVPVPNAFKLLGVVTNSSGKLMPPAGAPGAGGGMKITIPNLIELRQLMLSSPDVALGKITDFAKAVKSLFLHILPLAPGGSDPTLLASLLISTRTEKKMGDEDMVALIAEITEFIQDGRLDMTDEFSMSQGVGAMQLTSYCMEDGFTHAMLVDDTVNDYDNSLKTSLVIQTDPADPAKTFGVILEAFIEHNVKVPLSVDKQNKGVQLKFTAS